MSERSFFLVGLSAVVNLLGSFFMVIDTSKGNSWLTLICLTSGVLSVCGIYHESQDENQ